MNYDQSPGPYSTPSGKAGKPMGEQPMRYMYAFQYIFENPNWITNVLLATVCFLIPVVGPIVLIGYQFQIIEALLMRRTATYPDFDFNQFGQLLTRGVWPFLAAMIPQMVYFMIVMFFGIFGFMATIAITAGVSDSSEGLGMLCFLSGMFFIFAAAMTLSVLFSLAMIPMTLAAGLSQEFGPAFNFAFVRDFVARVWKEMILSSLFLTFAALVLAPIGALVFCIGSYVVLAVLMLANAHLLYQLYALYLTRGGMPVPLKDGK